ncbi:MAG TPA: DUF4328 domain-containing protein [Actinokineospora sp.]|jgi:hypothetical protein|nr:DUF4328 domain-containing protein [Actinokineospora sp.]
MTTPAIPSVSDGPPARYITLRPVRATGVAAGALIGVAIAASLAVAWATWDGYFLVQRYLWDDPAVGISDLDAADDRTSNLNWIYIAALVAAGVVYVTWLYRARWNSEILCDAEQRRSKGWVIGSWICPVVNLWFPFQVVSDIWKTSDPTTPARLAGLRSDRLDELKWIPGSGLVALWWGCLAASAVISRVSRILLLGDNPTIEAYHSLAVAGTLAVVLEAAAGVLMILVIRQLVSWQERARTA